MSDRDGQDTGDENARDPVNAGVSGDLKSPTHGQSQEFLEDDNNAHQVLFPLERIRHAD